MKGVPIVVLLVGCASAPAPAGRPVPPPAGPPTWQDPRPFVDAFRSAVGHMYEKDYQTAAPALARAAELAPNDDVVLYLTAKNELHLGHTDDALTWLTRLDDLGSDLVPDPIEFAAVVGDANFQRARAAAQARAAARSQGVTEAFHLSENGLVPEGIARDGRSRAFYVSSVKKRKIVRFLDGKADDFVPTARGFHAFLGLRVDEARRVLWAASEADKDENGFKPADEGRCELVAFDLATGQTKARYPTPGGEKHLLNDIALAADGSAFVTDSETGAVWALSPAEKALRIVVPAGRFVYPNGIAYDEASRALFVADMLTVWRVSPTSGDMTPLPFSAGAGLEGVDGLYLAGDWLVGVQNIVGSGRVLAWRLDPAHEKVTGRRVLVSAHPAFATPTTGAIVGNVLFLLANSTIGGARQDEAPIVLQVPLPA